MPGRAAQSLSQAVARQEAVEALIQANLLGSFWCCKVIGKHMADRGYGKIINIGSIAGIVGRNDAMYDKNEMQRQPIDYAVAKAGPQPRPFAAPRSPPLARCCLGLSDTVGAAAAAAGCAQGWAG